MSIRQKIILNFFRAGLLLTLSYFVWDLGIDYIERTKSVWTDCENSGSEFLQDEEEDQNNESKKITKTDFGLFFFGNMPVQPNAFITKDRNHFIFNRFFQLQIWLVCKKLII